MRSWRIQTVQYNVIIDAYSILNFLFNTDGSQIQPQSPVESADDVADTEGEPSTSGNGKIELKENIQN